MTMYLVFIYENIYPSGGWNDFEKAFTNIGDAIDYAKENADEDSNFQIVDSISLNVVCYRYMDDITLDITEVICSPDDRSLGVKTICTNDGIIKQL